MTETDEEGRFQIYAEQKHLTPEMKILLLDKPWELEGGRKILYEKEIAYKSHTIKTGPIKVNFWNYRNDIPRLDKSSQSSQSFTELFLDRIAIVAAKFDSIGLRLHLERNQNDPSKIDRCYNDSLTHYIEKISPGKTRNGEWMGIRVLNGFAACPLRKGSKPHKFQVVYNWDGISFQPGLELPNACLRLKLKSEKLIAYRVDLQWKNKPWSCFKQHDEDFNEALKAFRSAYANAGEVDEHQAAVHINLEQYALAAFRNLRKSPLTKLLFPHLKNLAALNDYNDAPDSRLSIRTALSQDGVEKRIKERLGSLDWEGFKPRMPISSQDSYALAGSLAWKIIGEWVDIFTNDYRDEILIHYNEWYNFSEDLVEHSVPYRPLDGEDLKVWADLSEIDPSKAPRIQRNGVLKAVRPPASSPEFNEADFAKLKQVCRYIIYFAVFKHSWIQNLVHADLGNFDYAVIKNRGWKVKPEPKDLLEQMERVHIHTNMKFGSVNDKEVYDVDQQFIDLWLNFEKEFESMGFKVQDFIHLSINI
jgi:hypothetical protein